MRAAGEIGFLGDVGCGERLRRRMTHDVDMGAGPMRWVVRRSDRTHLRAIFMLVGRDVGSGEGMNGVSNWVIYFRRI